MTSYCEDIKKRPLFIRKTVVFFLSVTSLVFAGTGDTYQEVSPRDAFVSAGLGDARILIPFLADDTVSAGICGLIYNGLTRTDKDLNVAGDLAERWEVSDDGLTITFYLREGVKWHDGTPFTADDVRFTFETILDPDTGCPYISGYTDIDSIEVTGPRIVSFIYKRPYAPALVKLGMGIIPRHIFEKENDIRGSKYARAPVGTGPYVFSRWKSGEYIVLDANPGYYEHVPGIKRYVFRIVPDQSVEFLELISGGVDAMELDPYQYRYRSHTPEFGSRLNKYSYLAPSYTYIGYNLKDGILNDVRVRRALGYAIDKKKIIDSVLLGLGEECTGPFRKNSVYYNNEVLSCAYDPGKARDLLREAGWSDTDGDGVLEKDGREFIISLATNQGSRIREDVAVVVQDHWAGIGVRAEIRVVAWAGFLDQFIDKKDFQAVILGWTLPVDPDCYSVWHSASINDKGGLNFVSYENSEVDDLIEQGRETFDPVTREEVYRRIHRLIAEDAPYTFLFFPNATPAVNKRFNGIEPAPAGIAHNFIDWYVPEDEVRYKF